VQKDKVNYKKFKEFIIKHDALRGFNLTESLYQKLYAELDPHKKTYLNLADWKSAFQTFNYHENLMVELKNFLQVQFANVESAYAFFQSFGNSQNIDFLTFSRASQSLIATRKLSDKQLRHMFNRVTGGDKAIFDQTNFESEFANIEWKGKQVINTHKGVHQMKGNTNIDSKKRGSQLVSKWETEIIEKLRRIIKNSGKSIDTIFAQFDVDGSGDITGEEFKQAIKMISLGITDTEIDRLMQRVDANMDGYVSYLEFAAKFRDDPTFDHRMKNRANDLLAEYKERMIMYMTSATDAYRMVS
jgi:Ca2+-binding EF-hand superfamily protein